jgi:hypothetical protein
VSLERSPFSLVSTFEELLERRSSGSSLEIREYGRGDPSLRPRGILYPRKLALTSPTSGDRSVGIVLLRTKATELLLLLVLVHIGIWIYQEFYLHMNVSTYLRVMQYSATQKFEMVCIQNSYVLNICQLYCKFMQAFSVRNSISSDILYRVLEQCFKAGNIMQVIS